ncbi:hypothetical protein BELL_1944g00010 [Botrytis elliptica]|uniref:Uncharacterized protein n=1 Tax=Botrytis elliptica TaxID=278938 RepID=A0A4Z1HQC3_9HELO|nr:hypothetical protein BELL_1944g00010 [Botrytis elliptica]
MPCHWQPRGERRCNGPKEPGTIFCDELTIHGGVKNTPPAPSNPAPPPATTPPAPAARTPANSPNVPLYNTSPPPTAVDTNATWTIVYACARPRIVFAIVTSVPRQIVGS